MDEQILAYAWALILAAGLVFRLHRLAASPRDYAERAHVAVFAFAFLGTVTQLPPIYSAINSAAAVPNLALLLSAELISVSGWCVHVFYLFLRNPGASLGRSLPLRLIVLLVVVFIEAYLFFLIDARDEVSGVGAFRAQYGDSQYVLLLSIVIYAWAGWTFFTIAQISHHYARLSVRPMSKLGFDMSSLGALFGVANALVSEAVLVLRNIGLPYPQNIQALDHALVVIAMALILAGQTMPLWGPKLGIPRLLRWVTTYWTFLALYPLWRDLCKACPEVALAPPSANPLTDILPRDLGFRLYRRLIEILDARLALRSYMDRDLVALAIQDLASAHAREPDAALLEASTLGFALRAKTLDLPPSGKGALVAVPGSAGLDAELSFFTDVSIAWLRSRLVQRVVNELVSTATKQATQNTRAPATQHLAR
jgi:hypothetical protein